MEIDRVKRLYTHLWRATEALGSAFALPTLLYLMVSFVTATILLYFLAMSCKSSAPFFMDTISIMAFNAFFYLTMIILCLCPADTPVDHVSTRSFFANRTLLHTQSRSR